MFWCINFGTKIVESSPVKKMQNLLLFFFFFDKLRDQNETLRDIRQREEAIVKW